MTRFEATENRQKNRFWASPERRRRLLGMLAARVAVVLAITVGGVAYALLTVEARKEIRVLCPLLQAETDAAGRNRILATLAFTRAREIEPGRYALGSRWLPGAGSCTFGDRSTR